VKKENHSARYEPLNSQIIDKFPPHLMLRDLRRLNICVLVHEDIPELL